MYGETFIQFKAGPEGPFQTVALREPTTEEADRADELKADILVSEPDSEGYAWVLVEKKIGAGK